MQWRVAEVARQVDDRVGLEAVAAGRRAPPAALEASFTEGGAALRTAGFAVHPDKRVRDSRHAAPLGIELRGDSGLAGAERARRHALARLSLAAALRGFVHTIQMRVGF